MKNKKIKNNHKYLLNVANKDYRLKMKNKKNKQIITNVY